MSTGRVWCPLAEQRASTDDTFVYLTHRASSIDGSRAVHLSRKRQLRMMFASVDAAADCALAAVFSEAF